MLASSWVEIDGEDWARLKEILFRDAAALAPILSAMHQRDNHSVITHHNGDSGPSFGQQARLESVQERRSGPSAKFAPDHPSAAPRPAQPSLSPSPCSHSYSCPADKGLWTL